MTSLRPFRGSSSRLVVLAALAVLAGLLPGTASAEPQRGMFVVEGQGNRSAIVDITAETYVQMTDPLLTGGDRYAGVVMEYFMNDRFQVVLAAATVRAFRDETSQGTGRYGSWSFQPGRYRVTLLGDGPVRAEWQLGDPDAPGLLVTPRTPVPARFLGRAEPLASGLSEARVDLPRALPAGRQVLQVTLLDGSHTDDVTMCATTGEECPRPLLPACLPSPAPCSVAERPLLPTRHSSGGPSLSLSFAPASAEVRALRWSVEGYREEPDRLRAAAIVF